MSPKISPLPNPALQAARPDAERWAAPADKPPPPSARDDEDGATKDAAARPRILIVEDDFLVAADLEAALLDGGYDVIGVAETANSAVELAAAQRPTLILMDIRLVGSRDGIEAAIQIFREHGIRSLFVSAHSDELARRRAAPAKPLGWLQKPYSMGRAIEAVREALYRLADVP